MRKLQAQIRVAGDEGAIMRLAGYAARFNSYSQDLGGFREKILPGAFKKSLASADVRCLMNHDPNLVLGRMSSRTLRVMEDSEGLRFEVILPNTQQARDLYETVKRGDINQCSFAFTVDEDGDEWSEDVDERGNRFIARTLRAVNVFDVSAVTFPAYTDTTVGIGDVS
jgi:HK97 family phage prohead protease